MSEEKDVDGAVALYQRVLEEKKDSSEPADMEFKARATAGIGELAADAGVHSRVLAADQCSRHWQLRARC